MDFVPPQFVIVQCRLTVPRVSHLIDLINSWSMNSIEYDQGVVVNRDLFWIPGSLEPIAPVNGGGGDNGGGFGGGGGGFGGGGGGGGGGFGGGGGGGGGFGGGGGGFGGGGGGNNQQNDQQNNEQALGGDAVVPDVVDVVYDGGNETGQNFLNKRKRKMEQTTIQKKLKMKQE